MQPEVNTAEVREEEKTGGEVRGEPRSDAHPADPGKRTEQRTVTLEGDLRVTRSGPLRALLLVTGLALLVWIGRGLAALLGLRHPVTLTLEPRGLQIRGERRFMGLGLGKTERFVPLGALLQLDLVGRSGLWVLVSAVVVLGIAVAVGATLVLWGIAGREPSWLIGGLLVIGLGLALDAASYLWTRRCLGRGRADLELRTRGSRLRMRRVKERPARQLVQRIARGD